MCNKFHEQNQFHKKKNQHTSFTNKNQHATSSMDKISFMWRKFNIEVSRRENSTCNMFYEQKSALNKLNEKKKSVRNKFHSQNELHEAKNQCTRFKKRKSACNMFNEEKNQHATSSTNKNKHRMSSMQKISFTRRENQCKSLIKRKTKM